MNGDQRLADELARTRVQLDEARALAEQSRDEADRMEEEAELAHRRIQALEAQLMQVRGEADRMEAEAEDAHALIQALEGDLSAASEATESLRAELAGRPRAGEEAAARIQMLETDLARAQAEAEALRAQLAPAAPEPDADHPPRRAADQRDAAIDEDAGPRPKVPVWADPRPINLNTADIEELMLLPGIGRRPAERILEARAETAFRSVDDLYAIEEIPKDRITRIRGYVRV